MCTALGEDIVLYHIILQMTFIKSVIIFASVYQIVYSHTGQITVKWNGLISILRLEEIWLYITYTVSFSGIYYVISILFHCYVYIVKNNT